MLNYNLTEEQRNYKLPSDIYRCMYCKTSYRKIGSKRTCEFECSKLQRFTIGNNNKNKKLKENIKVLDISIQK